MILALFILSRLYCILQWQKNFQQKLTMKYIPLCLMMLLAITSVAQKSKTYQLSSPDGNIVIKIDAGNKLQWSVLHKSQTVLSPSAISLQLNSGEVLGDKASITSAKTESVNKAIAAINYKKATIPDVYNGLTLNCKGDYGIIFRAYNDGATYRFFTRRKGTMEVKNEEAVFNFESDYRCLLPYVRDLRGKEQYVQSFEALYTDQKLSQVFKDSLAFGPVLVDVGNGKKQ